LVGHADDQPGTVSLQRVASTCSRCGTTSDGDGLAPGWSLSTSTDGLDRLCERCTRDHVRDIEAKLDETWWGSPGGSGRQP
jgi:hypothetical protein